MLRVLDLASLERNGMNGDGFSRLTKSLLCMLFFKSRLNSTIKAGYIRLLLF
jgi:hypothetical protein